MQIDVDFDTFKTLTALRRHENDSIGDVISRLIRDLSGVPVVIGNAVDLPANGLFMGSVLFPNGTRFRAHYKGKPFSASVINGVWTDADGTTRNSPSEAASAISNTNVNGWRFWEAQFPNSAEWTLLDRLRGR